MMPQNQVLGPPQPPPGYYGGQQQPPPMGYPPAPVGGPAPAVWDPSAGHPSTVGHNDVPSPGEIHLTTKQYITRLSVALLSGIVIGGIIMFRLFPIFIRIIQAAAGA